MREIKEGFLLSTSQREINNKSIEYMWHRLCMFLAYSDMSTPNIVFTSNRDRWIKYGGGYEHTSCFYDEDTGTIVFNADYYYYTSTLVTQYVPIEIIEYAKEKNYIYIVPIADIYHEMIHHVQFSIGSWTHNDLLEASAELFCYMITNYRAEEYYDEMIGFWYIAKYILKLKHWEIYLFVRDSIVDENFYIKYFSNPAFVKYIADKYSGSVEKFWSTFKLKNAKHRFKIKMLSDINKIHNDIFYKW